MSAEELFVELAKLNRVEKLRDMQILVVALASEEDALLIPERQYEVWLPFDASSAADKLMKMLERA